ncbi:hypothetical protein, partial [Pseudorhizobium flavum]|uniref:hypothetical protein n=1 Tax=Pseudorhizobium flavum TaxID=1335061 RepID=UPI00249211CC
MSSSKTEPKLRPRKPPTTFLFLPFFNCQKTDETAPKRHPVAKSPCLQAQNPKPNQHALIFKDFSRTKNIVASSAAALVG